MKYYEQIKLKNGTDCILRNPTGADAQAILSHMILTSAETNNMLRYPDEITLSEEAERDYLSELEESEKTLMLAAVVGDKVIANAGLQPVFWCGKCKHRAEFGISIQKAYWGCGVGSAVLKAALEQARRIGYTQVELEVITENTRAIALYKKFGFVRYGTNKKAFRCRDGQYQALDLMVCEL
ncbi:MAG: GNAT family N-acetyltransferase [Ruthenibacterium sp.]